MIKWRRMLAVLLSGSMLFGSVSAPVLAAEVDDTYVYEAEVYDGSGDYTEETSEEYIGGAETYYEEAEAYSEGAEEYSADDEIYYADDQDADAAEEYEDVLDDSSEYADDDSSVEEDDYPSDDAAAEIVMQAAEAAGEISAFSEDGSAEIVETGKCGDDLTWSFDESGTLTISGTGEMYDEQYGMFPAETKYVVIEEGPEDIGSRAFSGYSKLQSVIMPASVNFIGGDAFYRCTSLSEITLYSGTGMSEDAFEYCDNLTKVTLLGEGRVGYIVRQIDNPDSGSCHITTVILEGDFTEISFEAFLRMDQLQTIEIPGTVTSIEYSAFSGCKSLENITLPESLTEMGDGVFSGCSALKSVTIPAGLSDISDDAFRGCSSLEEVIFSEGLKSIEDNAFSRCSALTSVSLPDSLETLGRNVFYYCTNLKEVTLYSDLDVDSSFDGCSALTDVTLLGEGTVGAIVRNMDGYGDNGDHITTVNLKGDFTAIGSGAFEWMKKLRSVQMPDTVTCIEREAFYNCESLESVTLPETVNEIKYRAFSGCTNLKEINIPDAVTFIGYQTFENCSSLESIVIPDDVTSIASKTFYGCESLSSVTIGSGVESIYQEAFSGCSGLRSISLPRTLSSISSDSFLKCTDLAEIQVDAKNKTFDVIDNVLFSEAHDVLYLYPSAKAGNYEIPDGVQRIGAYAFSDASALTGITIPNSVTRIESYTFADCDQLSAVVIPNSVSSVGDHAFSGCSALESAVLGAGIYGLSNYMFSGCTGLKQVHISEGTKSIGTAAFENCSGLERICLPTSIQTVAASVFKDCANLSEILYYGTEEEFEDITVGASNSPFKNADVHYSSHPYTKTVSTIHPCEEDEITTYTSTVCDHVYTEKKIAKGHKYSYEWKYKDADTHVINCSSCGDEARAEAHEWHTTSSTTLSSGGSKQILKCYSCGATKERIIPTWTLTPSSATAYVSGSAVKLTLKVTPSNADYKADWRSSDDSIAAVDQKGNVTGLKAGTATIKVVLSSKDGTYEYGSSSTKITVKNPSISYQAKVLGKSGWDAKVTNGADAGTTGKSLIMEAMRASLVGVSGNSSKLKLKYRVHIQTTGWTGWMDAGKTGGIVNGKKRMEAVSIRLEGTDADKYDIYYCLHVQNFGWLNWAKNGQDAGSSGLSRRVEAFRIMLVPKGTAAPKKPGSWKNCYVKGVAIKTLKTSTSKLTVNRGKTATVGLTVLPANATFKNYNQYWTSSNTSVATVTNKGVVTGKKKGTCTITVKSVDGRATTKFTVVVK